MNRNPHELREAHKGSALLCFVEGASLMLAPAPTVEARAAAMVHAAIAIVHLQATDTDGRVRQAAQEMVAVIQREKAASEAARKDVTE